MGCQREPAANDVEALSSAARTLAELAPASSPVAAQALELAERLDRGRFVVAVCGAFNRGKSSVCNALIGRDMLPAGVLPLTAVATEVSFGEEHLTVVHVDGRRTEAAIEELARYATEEGNPANELGVAKVELQLAVELLRPGVVLVDTPGLESIFRHNSDAAREAIVAADGAVVVLSADAPLSQGEVELLELVAHRSARTFFVLNRIDHLSPAELDRVRQFVTQTIAGVSTAVSRAPDRLYCMSARDALRARLAGDDDALASSGFAEFQSAFAAFVNDDLVSTRLEAARRRIAALAVQADAECRVEEAALRLSAAELDQRLTLFRQAAAEQRRLFEQDRVLLRDAVSRISVELAQVLARVAQRVPDDALAELDRLVAITPLRRVDGVLADAVEQAVRDHFDRVRSEEADRVESAWRTAALEFRGRVQARVEAVRSAAADTFDVELGPLEVPGLATQHQRLFYLFIRLDRPEQAVARWVRPLLPHDLVRRRLARAARRRLASEIEKHAGRARWDLTQRLDGARRDYEAVAEAQLVQFADGIAAAAARAARWREAAAQELSTFERSARQLRSATQHALALANGRC